MESLIIRINVGDEMKHKKTAQKNVTRKYNFLFI